MPFQLISDPDHLGLRRRAVRYTGINHLALVTGDMDATIRFWRDLIGLRLVAGIGHPGFRHYFFEISATDMLAFFEWDGAEPLAPKDHGAPIKGPMGFDHVSIGVASEDDLWDLKDRLEAADIWVSEVVDHGFIRSIYAFDPNEIAIEFSVPRPDVDLRAWPKMMDTQPTAVAEEGSEPVPGQWPEVTEPTPAAERVAHPGDGQQLVSCEAQNGKHPV
jgi:catechol 2,3-dioxygenase-like lactoylglutathione lyase family enzyme